MTEDLAMIPPSEVRDVWPTIRERVQELSDLAGCDWLAEDVFAQLTAPQPGAFLWGTEDLKGFVVLQIDEQPWGRYLHCWLAHNESDPSCTVFWEQLQGIAAQHNCRRVRFESPRRGFGRALPGVRSHFIYTGDEI